jgi:hypothetical protein
MSSNPASLKYSQITNLVLVAVGLPCALAAVVCFVAALVVL